MTDTPSPDLLFGFDSDAARRNIVGVVAACVWDFAGGHGASVLDGHPVDVAALSAGGVDPDSLARPPKMFSALSP